MIRIALHVCLFFLYLVMQSPMTNAQNIYELRKMTEDDWLSMSTEERLNALGKSFQHETNQTYIGKFGRNQDLYRKWGYDYYEMEDRYENYSFRNFESYNILEVRRRKWSYNEFGDRISLMRHSATLWNEQFQGNDTHEWTTPSSYINASSGGVDGVWVARESTEDWAISVIGAGALRTKFTPLTLSLPNMDGISIDWQSSNTALKLISSAYVGSDTNLVKKGGVMLRGGRLKHKFGLLTLGATYATAYGVQGNRQKGDEWRGTVTNETPTPVMVAVRFLDDSPEDGVGGPIIYDLKLKINGKVRNDLIPQVFLDDINRDITSAVTDKYELDYVEPGSAAGEGRPKFDFLSINERIPKYLDLMYFNNSMKGHNLEATSEKFDSQLAESHFAYSALSGKPLSANGSETIVFLFDLMSMTDKLVQVEALTTVANDYRIQTAMIYTAESRGGHDASGREVRWYDATYWRTAAQSNGNIRDKSNLKTISIDFGYQIATVMMGIDMEIDHLGFKVRGEFVSNTTKYMFAEGAPGTGRSVGIIANQLPRTGHRFEEKDNAYYFIMGKEWDRFGFSGEIFKMGKFYRPYFDYFITHGGNIRNNIARVPLIEDNDDDDMYPDTMLVRRTIGYRVNDYEDPDGVFPGIDNDNDGYPDNNRNNNSRPDFDEPFFMFDIDPDEYVFGNDYNNNTIPDFREDDMKLDTPYELDRQGHHYFMRFSPISMLDLIGGSFKTKGVGLSNRTNDDYFKMVLNYDVFDVGKIYAEYRHERIQDNIRDAYVQVNREMRDSSKWQGRRSTSRRYDRELYYDELEYRNSRVNRLFLDSKIRVIPSLTVENYIKYEQNYQIEGDMYDNTYQQHDVLNTIAIINKFVYTRRWGNFEFSPGIKYRFYKKVRSESLQPFEYYLMRIPLVMLKYHTSESTNLMLGMQGIGWLPLKRTDYVQSQNNYSQKNQTLQLQNQTKYFGYNIVGAIGFSLEQIDYQNSFRSFEEYKATSLFLKMNIGW